MVHPIREKFVRRDTANPFHVLVVFQAKLKHDADESEAEDVANCERGKSRQIPDQFVIGHMSERKKYVFFGHPSGKVETRSVLPCQGCTI